MDCLKGTPDSSLFLFHHKEHHYPNQHQLDEPRQANHHKSPSLPVENQWITPALATLEDGSIFGWTWLNLQCFQLPENFLIGLLKPVWFHYLCIGWHIVPLFWIFIGQLETYFCCMTATQFDHGGKKKSAACVLPFLFRFKSLWLSVIK